MPQSASNYCSPDIAANDQGEEDSLMAWSWSGRSHGCWEAQSLISRALCLAYSSDRRVQAEVRFDCSHQLA